MLEQEALQASLKEVTLGGRVCVHVFIWFVYFLCPAQPDRVGNGHRPGGPKALGLGARAEVGGGLAVSRGL